jgi:hypothetical protein
VSQRYETILLIFLLLGLSIVVVFPVYATSVQACYAPAGDFCTVMILNLTSGDQVTGSVSVTGGSGNDVIFYIMDPSGAKIYSAGKISGGTTFSFTATQNGAYTLVFDNSFSIFSAKQVTVSYNVSPTVIPGTSPGTSYAIIIAIVILVLIIVTLLMRRSRKHYMQHQAPQPAQPS